MPQVDFTDLDKLSGAEIDNIRRRGCLVIRNVVDDNEALSWRDDMREYVKVNPVNGERPFRIFLSQYLLKADYTLLGFPDDNKQFFQL